MRKLFSICNTFFCEKWPDDLADGYIYSVYLQIEVPHDILLWNIRNDDAVRETY